MSPEPPGALVGPLGIDGWSGGWVGASVERGGVRWHTWSLRAPDLLSRGGPIGIDMPIGLPVDGRRAADTAAREALGPRRSTVFFVPPRRAFAAADHAQACRMLPPGLRPSVQLWGIADRIRHVDGLLLGRRADEVIETHPELSFLGMQAAPLPPKRTAAGVGHRIAALSGWLGADVVVAALAHAPDRIPVDDALDALACLWSANRWALGSATVLGDGSADAHGLPMRIVV